MQEGLKREWMEFVQLPAYQYMRIGLEEMLQVEARHLLADALEQPVEAIRRRAGVIEGIKRVLGYLDEQKRLARAT